MTGSESGGVVLLTHEGDYARAVAAAVAAALDLKGILVQRPAPEPRAARPATGIKRMAWDLLGPALYTSLQKGKARLAQGEMERRVDRIESDLEQAARLEYESRAGRPPAGWPGDRPRHGTESVNDPAAVEWCRALLPDLLLVFGTAILKPPMIRVPRLGVLNVHTSILPAYRGTFSEFWQASRGDLGSAGVTIHFIDEGVDTGDIVAQKSSNPPQGADPWRIRVENLLVAPDLLVGAARSVLDGAAARLPQGETTTPVFRTRDLTLKARVDLLRNLGHPI